MSPLLSCHIIVVELVVAEGLWSIEVVTEFCVGRGLVRHGGHCGCGWQCWYGWNTAVWLSQSITDIIIVVIVAVNCHAAWLSWLNRELVGAGWIASFGVVVCHPLLCSLNSCCLVNWLFDAFGYPSRPRLLHRGVSARYID